MNYGNLTKKVLLIAIALLVGYDVFIILFSGKESSISWIVIEYSYSNPIIPFSVGVVCGHLFWRMKNPKENVDNILLK